MGLHCNNCYCYCCCYYCHCHYYDYYYYYYYCHYYYYAYCYRYRYHYCYCYCYFYCHCCYYYHYYYIGRAKVLTYRTFLVLRPFAEYRSTEKCDLRGLATGQRSILYLVLKLYHYIPL